MKTTEELRKEVERLQKQLKAAEALERRTREQEWKALVSNPKNWEWRVTPKVDSWTKVAGLRVEKRIKPAILANWHGSLGDEAKWRGMFYFRTREDLLTHLGGGWRILKTPCHVTDEEWKMLESGNIPEDFKA